MEPSRKLKVGRRLGRKEGAPSVNGCSGNSAVEYATGSRVPQTGIYEVIHHGQHRQAHEAVLVSGNRFPRCEGCGDDLGFRLVRAVPYIFHDEDFAL